MSQSISPANAIAELQTVSRNREKAYGMPKRSARQRRDRCRAIQVTWLSEKVVWDLVQPNPVLADQDHGLLLTFASARAMEFAAEQAKFWGDRADRHAADMAEGL